MGCAGGKSGKKTFDKEGNNVKESQNAPEKIPQKVPQKLPQIKNQLSSPKPVVAQQLIPVDNNTKNPGGAVEITINKAVLNTNPDLENSLGTYVEVQWLDDLKKFMKNILPYDENLNVFSEKTSLIRGGKEPVWNQELSMDIGQKGAKGNFYIRVYVSYGESKKELIGETEFDVVLVANNE